MPITFHCPHCNARYIDVDDELLGRTARCRRCSGRFRIQPETGLPLPPKVEKTPLATTEKTASSPTVVFGDDEEEAPTGGAASTRVAEDTDDETDEPETAETEIADVSETFVADVNETVVADVNETVVADVNETVVADVNETVVADVNETVVADVSETVVADVSETVVEAPPVDDDAPTVMSTRGGLPHFDDSDPNIDKMIATVSGGGATRRIVGSGGMERGRFDPWASTMSSARWARGAWGKSIRFSIVDGTWSWR